MTGGREEFEETTPGAAVPASGTPPDGSASAGPADLGREDRAPPAAPPAAPDAATDQATTRSPSRLPRRLPRTRAGGLWVTAVVAAVVLLFLLIFILQNGQRVQVSFLGVEGQLPLGVALLLAAACGVLLVAIPGTGRILQLRRQARKRASAAATEDRAAQEEGR